MPRRNVSTSLLIGNDDMSQGPNVVDGLPHIEIAKEPDWLHQRRPRPSQFGRPSPPAPPDRAAHADELIHPLEDSSTAAEAFHQETGIDPNRLQVLQFNAVNFAVEEKLQQRFGVRIVQ